MRAMVVVAMQPVLGHRAHFLQRFKDMAVEHLGSAGPVEMDVPATLIICTKCSLNGCTGNIDHLHQMLATSAPTDQCADSSDQGLTEKVIIPGYRGHTLAGSFRP